MMVQLVAAGQGMAMAVKVAMGAPEKVRAETKLVAMSAWAREQAERVTVETAMAMLAMAAAEMVAVKMVRVMAVTAKVAAREMV